MKKIMFMMATVVALTFIGCGAKEAEVDGIAQEEMEADHQEEAQEDGAAENGEQVNGKEDEAEQGNDKQETSENNLTNVAAEDGKSEGDTTGTTEEANKVESNKEENSIDNQTEISENESSKTESVKSETVNTGSYKTGGNQIEVNKAETNKTVSKETESNKPSTSKPSTSKPSTNQSITKPEPTVVPVAPKPTIKPESTKPVAPKPTTKPESTIPEAPKPTTKPETTKPEATKPETTKPEVQQVDHLVKMEAIESKVAKGYEYYIPSMTFNETYFTEVLRVKPEWYDAALGKGPLMSAHVDTFVAIHPTEGNIDNVVSGLESYKDYLINDSFQYPMNRLKVRTATIEVIGDYVYFIMLGSVDSSITEEDELLKAFRGQNEIALEIIRNYK